MRAELLEPFGVDVGSGDGMPVGQEAQDYYNCLTFGSVASCGAPTSFDPAGLAAVVRSTEAWGRCTSASIYFGGDTPMPLFDMNMKGIRFDTGRVNAASLLPTVLALIGRHGLTPATLEASEVGWADMPAALCDGVFRPIAVRSGSEP